MLLKHDLERPGGQRQGSDAFALPNAVGHYVSTSDVLLQGTCSNFVVPTHLFQDS